MVEIRLTDKTCDGAVGVIDVGSVSGCFITVVVVISGMVVMLNLKQINISVISPKPIFYSPV